MFGLHFLSSEAAGTVHRFFKFFGLTREKPLAAIAIVDLQVARLDVDIDAIRRCPAAQLARCAAHDEERAPTTARLELTRYTMPVLLGVEVNKNRALGAAAGQAGDSAAVAVADAPPRANRLTHGVFDLNS